MMQAKIIKTETEYDQALARIDRLMDAKLGTKEGNELELLVTLVEMYEEQEYTIELPDAINAIRFRMEQQNLKQKDLIPFIGSKSKVSEVLSGKRQLSLKMMRKLHAGLAIPVAVLMQEPEAKLPKIPQGMNWDQFPLVEMLKRSWLSFKGTLPEAKEHAEELISRWAAPVGDAVLRPILLRQHVRGQNKSHPLALTAWRIRVSLLALDQDLPPYNPGMIDADFMRDLVKLSYFNNGPLLAKEFLMKNGIHFIVEPHLKGTHLDGAVMRTTSGAPLIALTLRHNRLDNFWFTLCHELAHLALHLDQDDWLLFFDDLDYTEEQGVERDADIWASNALIPTEKWQNSKLTNNNCNAQQIIEFAKELRINQAIPAGRVRREQNKYRRFSKLIGHGDVQKLFMPAV